MANLNLNKFTGKVDGQSTLTAAEWNECMLTIQNAVNNIEPSSGGGGGGGSISSGTSLDLNGETVLSVGATKSNLTLQTPSSFVNDNGKYGKINIESASDIQLKPSDDIILYSHHRHNNLRPNATWQDNPYYNASNPSKSNPSKSDAELQQEINLKVMNGSDSLTDGDIQSERPVKLQVNLANLTLTTKDKDLTAFGKSSAEDEILDININTGKSDGNQKGYLKLRARAIDLRCEEHGGIALQPKGTDSSGHENKIKFEHGGGDGLEFFTANTQKFSAFNDEYRFNKNGIWKQAERQKVDSSKYNLSDPTTQYKYQKNTDDFYDFFDANDEICDTKSIIKTANALNYGTSRSCKMDGTVYADSVGGFIESNLELKTKTTYRWIKAQDGVQSIQGFEYITYNGATAPNTNVVYDIKDQEISETFDNGKTYTLKYSLSQLDLKKTLAEQTWTENKVFYKFGNDYYVFVEIPSPGIKFESDKNIKLEASKKIGLDATSIETSSTSGSVSIAAGDGIELDKSTTGNGIVIKSPIVKFDGPTVQRFNSLNISATGKLLDGGYIEAAGEFNLQHSAVQYDKTAGKVYVKIEPVYNGSGEQLTSFTPDPDDSTKTLVYWDDAHTLLCRFLGSNGSAESGAKVFLPGTGEFSDKLWACDTTKNGELKAPSKAYNKSGEVGALDADHIICATLVDLSDDESDDGVLIYQGLPGTEFENTYYVTDFTILNSLTTGHDVVTIQPKREWQATTKQVSYADVVDFISQIKAANISFTDVASLVNWMKTNNQGPWDTV